MNRKPICLDCFNFMNILEHSYKSLKDIFNYNELNKVEDECINCSICNKRLIKNQYYFEDEVELEEYIEEAIPMMADLISKNIEFCSYCEGSEVEEIEYDFNRNFEEDGTDFETNVGYFGGEIYDLLNEYEIPDNKKDDVLLNLECQYCKRPVYDRKGCGTPPFGLYDKYYTKNELNRFSSLFFGEQEELVKKIRFLEKEFKVEEIEEFIEILYNQDKIPSKYAMFNELYKGIEKIFNEQRFYTLHDSKLLYRARTNNINNIYDKNDMWAPPVGKAGHGRFNKIGQSVLYCVNNPKGIFYEVEKQSDQKYNLAELILKKEMKMFPINIFFKDFEGFVFSDEEDKNLFKKKYVLTNLIGQICCDIGYNGIVYKSVKQRRYINYTFFNYNIGYDIEINRVDYIEADENPNEYDWDYKLNRSYEEVLNNTKIKSQIELDFDKFIKEID